MHRIFFVLAVASLGACHSRSEKTTSMIPQDPHSYSSQGDALVKHLALDLAVDFSSKQLRGTATWQIDNPAGGKKLVLDTRGLTIEKVILGDGRAATWRLGKEQPHMGVPLEIDIDTATESLIIHYSTAPDAA